jgi:hypothetical protein
MSVRPQCSKSPVSRVTTLAAFVRAIDAIIRSRGATRPADAAAGGKEIAIGDGSLVIERQNTAGEIILKHGARRRFEALAAATVGHHGDPGQDLRLANRSPE